MFVNATAGTTVYGAFDPINDIADICEKYKIWLHVDVRKASPINIRFTFLLHSEGLKQRVVFVFVQAAWGGGLLMSRKHRYKLNGIER